MTIIETVKDIIEKYPKIDEFTNNVHVDFLDNKEGEAGLFSIGDNKTGEDILGNQIRQCNLIMYATCQAVSDYDRLNNSNFLIDLGWYLEQIEEDTCEVVTGDRKGYIKNITASNAMLYQFVNGNVSGPVKYQIQLAVQYSVEV